MSDVQLYLGDCLEILPTLVDNSVDAVITDLPYGTTQCKWDEIIPFEPMWKHVLRICKGAFVTTSSQPFTSKLIMSKPKLFRYEWAWDKVNRYTGYLDANRKPLKRHENIVVFSYKSHTYNPQFFDGKPYKARRNGSPEIYNTHTRRDGESDGKRYPYSILSIKADRKAVQLHPAQKPIELYEYLIRTYTNEGDIICDIAMGSGTTGVACVQTGRKFIGIEIEEKYYKIAEERIKEAQMQLRLGI